MAVGTRAIPVDDLLFCKCTKNFPFKIGSIAKYLYLCEYFPNENVYTKQFIVERCSVL